MAWYSKGQSLIEILVGMGVAAVLLPAIFTAVMATREGRVAANQNLQFAALVREMHEAVRSVRARGWTQFAVNGVFHPQVISNQWQLALGSEVVDGLTRSILIADDGSDQSSKKVTLMAGTLIEDIYLTRYLDNLIFTQTLQSEFDGGVKSGTITTNITGGEITLGSGGQGNWCEPNLSIAALDLPKNGVANALSAVEGLVFAGTGDNASGVSFAKVVINNTNPPTMAVSGTFDGYKTNAVFGEPSYAYLATDNNTKEIVIINLSNLTEIGSFNAPGSNSGTSIVTSGSVGFMTSANKMYSFDLSSHTGARTQLGNVTLAGNGKKIFIVGTYAYVVNSGTSNQLQIIDISNPNSLSIVGQVSLGSSGGVDVYVNSVGTRAYVATSGLYIVNISNKASPSLISSYSPNGMTPKGLTVVTGNKVILVGSGGEEYQVVDITTENALVRCGGLNIDSGVNGVSSVLEQDGDAYSNIITGDTTSELKIIAGGPGGRYTSSGTYTSASFNPGYSTSFNRLSFSGSIPVNTDLKAQIAVSTDCQSFIYIGPDGTSNTFYSTIGGAFPIDLNTGSCLRYQLFLSTTTSSATPVFNDITVNYSP